MITSETKCKLRFLYEQLCAIKCSGHPQIEEKTVGRSTQIKKVHSYSSDTRERKKKRRMRYIFLRLCHSCFFCHKIFSGTLLAFEYCFYLVPYLLLGTIYIFSGIKIEKRPKKNRFLGRPFLSSLLLLQLDGWSGPACLHEGSKQFKGTFSFHSEKEPFK